MALLTSLVAVFLVAFVGAFAAKKLNQPILTGYLLSGVLATIFLGKFIRFNDVSVLADLGLAFLMFTVGLDFSFRRLSRVKEIAVFGAIAQMLITAVIFGILGSLGWLGNLGTTEILILGIVFSLSSTAIVVKLLSEKGELDTLPSEIIVGWLLVQDLAVVPILVILGQLGGLGNLGMMGLAGKIGLAILKAGIILYLVLFLGKKIIPRVLAKVSEVGSREVLLIAVVGLVMLSAGATKALGLSFALGAFLAGLLIAESASEHAIFSEIRPLRDVFAVIFFVTLGVLISPQYLLTNWPLVLKLVILVTVVKFAVSLGVTLFFHYHLKTALQVALSLIQVGEFAFVVSRIGLSLGVLTQNTYSLILSVTILTMMVTPWEIGLSVSLYEHLRSFTGRWSPALYKVLFAGFDRYKKDHPEITLTNHVVICGHGRVGKHVARILAMARVPYLVVDYNQNAIRDLDLQGVETVLGDPADRDVLEFARADCARAIVVAVPDRYSQELIIANALNLQPGVVVICRSHFEEDYRRLYALGVTAVVSPEFEAGLSMAHRILDSIGMDRAQTAGYLKQLRKEQSV